MMNYVWLVAGCVLALWTQARAEIPIAMWIAPAFLLQFSHSQPAWLGLPILLAVSYLVIVVSERGMIPARGPAYFAYCIPIAVSSTVPFLADRLLASRITGFASTLVFPLAWAVMDFGASRFSPSSSWGSSAHTQHGNLPLIQMASVTGLPGISFLVAWFASTLEWSWSQSFSAHSIWTGVLPYATMLAAVLI